MAVEEYSNRLKEEMGPILDRLEQIDPSDEESIDNITESLESKFREALKDSIERGVGPAPVYSGYLLFLLDRVEKKGALRGGAFVPLSLLNQTLKGVLLDSLIRGNLSDLETLVSRMNDLLEHMQVPVPTDFHNAMIYGGESRDIGDAEATNTLAGLLSSVASRIETAISAIEGDPDARTTLEDVTGSLLSKVKAGDPNALFSLLLYTAYMGPEIQKKKLEEHVKFNRAAFENLLPEVKALIKEKFGYYDPEVVEEALGIKYLEELMEKEG